MGFRGGDVEDADLHATANLVAIDDSSSRTRMNGEQPTIPLPCLFPAYVLASDSNTKIRAAFALAAVSALLA